MLKPLEQWICDICGEVIEKPEDGYILWKHDQDLRDYDFKIIHHLKCDADEYPLSTDLESFLGENGRSKLLSILSVGPIKINIGQTSRSNIKDLDEFADLFRRLQLPYYEEARIKFHNRELLENYSDANEYFPYRIEELKKIIETEFEE